MGRNVMFATTLCVVCGCWLWAGLVSADSPRHDEPKALVTMTELPSDFANISWAAEPAATTGVVMAVSPERLDVAGGILANLLSDPSFRYQVQVWFEHYESINHPPDEAAAMAKGHAAAIALAFTDALIEAAGW